MAIRGMDFINLLVIKEHKGGRVNILKYEYTSFFPPLKVFSLGGGPNVHYLCNGYISKVVYYDEISLPNTHLIILMIISYNIL
jgi:hypothetical protein